MFDQQDELYVLMEAAEAAFTLGEPANYEWHAARPGESPWTDYVRTLADAGLVQIVVERPPGEHRDIALAKLTDAGRQRMDELIRAGVRPRDHGN